MSDDQAKPSPVVVFIDPGTAPGEEISELIDKFLALYKTSPLYEKLGDSGLKFEIIIPKEEGS